MASQSKKPSARPRSASTTCRPSSSSPPAPPWLAVDLHPSLPLSCRLTTDPSRRRRRPPCQKKACPACRWRSRGRWRRGATRAGRGRGPPASCCCCCWPGPARSLDSMTTTTTTTAAAAAAEGVSSTLGGSADGRPPARCSPRRTASLRPFESGQRLRPVSSTTTEVRRTSPSAVTGRLATRRQADMPPARAGPSVSSRCCCYLRWVRWTIDCPPEGKRRGWQRRLAWGRLQARAAGAGAASA